MCYIWNMDITKTHGFATGGLYSSPRAMWGKFFNGFAHFILFTLFYFIIAILFHKIIVFFCIFDQIDTALMSRRNLFKKKIQILLIPNFWAAVCVCIHSYIYIYIYTISAVLFCHGFFLFFPNRGKRQSTSSAECDMSAQPWAAIGRG